jgi:hypothetical protein
MTGDYGHTVRNGRPHWRGRRLQEARTMQENKVGTREEWRAARDELAARACI